VERVSVRGPAIGKVIMMPINAETPKRPSPEDVKLYGGGENRVGAIVEIMTTLDCYVRS